MQDLTLLPQEIYPGDPGYDFSMDIQWHTTPNFLISFGKESLCIIVEMAKRLYGASKKLDRLDYFQVFTYGEKKMYVISNKQDDEDLSSDHNVTVMMAEDY